MNSDSLPPFSQEYRASGLLLHVTSLPSRYGIGDVGRRRCRGSIASTMQAKAGGRLCRSGPRVTAIHPTNRFRPLPGTDWPSVRTGSSRMNC